MSNIVELARDLLLSNFSASLINIIQILDKGEVNDVYLLESYSGKYILRVNSISEFERFKKEKWCYENASALGVKGPKVFSVGKYEAQAYMLMEFIAGENGEKIISDKKLWEKLGKYLHNIHLISVNGFGENLDDINNGTIDQWLNYIDDNFRSLVNQEFVNLEILDAETSQKLAEMFAELRLKDFTFGLNHSDFSLANIIVDELDNPYVIDWGNAQAHVVPHHDLSVILDETLQENSEGFEALLRGYGMTMDQYLEIKEEIIAIGLLEASDKLRWALDNAPEWVDHYKKRIQSLTSRTFSRYI